MAECCNAVLHGQITSVFFVLDIAKLGVHVSRFVCGFIREIDSAVCSTCIYMNIKPNSTPGKAVSLVGIS